MNMKKTLAGVMAGAMAVSAMAATVSADQDEISLTYDLKRYAPDWKEGTVTITSQYTTSNDSSEYFVPFDTKTNEAKIVFEAEQKVLEKGEKQVGQLVSAELTLQSRVDVENYEQPQLIVSTYKYTRDAQVAEKDPDFILCNDGWLDGKQILGADADKDGHEEFTVTLRNDAKESNAINAAAYKLWGKNAFGFTACTAKLTYKIPAQVIVRKAEGWQYAFSDGKEKEFGNIFFTDKQFEEVVGIEMKDLYGKETTALKHINNGLKCDDRAFYFNAGTLNYDDSAEKKAAYDAAKKALDEAKAALEAGEKDVVAKTEALNKAEENITTTNAAIKPAIAAANDKLVEILNKNFANDADKSKSRVVINGSYDNTKLLEAGSEVAITVITYRVDVNGDRVVDADGNLITEGKPERRTYVITNEDILLSGVADYTAWANLKNAADAAVEAADKAAGEELAAAKKALNDAAEKVAALKEAVDKAQAAFDKAEKDLNTEIEFNGTYARPEKYAATSLVAGETTEAVYPFKTVLNPTYSTRYAADGKVINVGHNDVVAALKCRKADNNYYTNPIAVLNDAIANNEEVTFTFKTFNDYVTTAKSHAFKQWVEADRAYGYKTSDFDWYNPSFSQHLYTNEYNTYSPFGVTNYDHYGSYSSAWGINLFSGAIVVNSGLTMQLNDTQKFYWGADSLTFDWFTITDEGKITDAKTFLTSMLLYTPVDWYWDSLTVTVGNTEEDNIDTESPIEDDATEIPEEEEEIIFEEDEEVEEEVEEVEEVEEPEETEEVEEVVEEVEEVQEVVEETKPVEPAGSPATGNSPIALAVIPVALAAAAVVAKKRG